MNQLNIESIRLYNKDTNELVLEFSPEGQIMWTYLVKHTNSGNLLCGNCRMKQPVFLRDTCPFCGRMFSNYEEMVIDKFKEQEQENEYRNVKG